MGHDVLGRNSPHSDAELIATCVRFQEIDRQINEAYADRDFDTEDPLYGSLEAVVARICDLHAATLEGWQARARALAVYSPYLLGPIKNGSFQEKMTGALLRDLLA